MPREHVVCLAGRPFTITRNDDGSFSLPPELESLRGLNVALKPAWEVVLVFRKPLDGTVVQTVLAHGTGALNVDGCRVGLQNSENAATLAARSGGTRGFRPDGYVGGTVDGHLLRGWDNSKGRWPPNLVLSHVPADPATGTPGCVRVGTKRVRAGNSLSPSDSLGATWQREQHEVGPHYADADGLETVEDWRCAPGCPIRALDAQSGALTSGQLLTHHKRSGESSLGTFNIRDRTGESCAFGGDTGGASRFFPQFQAGAEDFAPGMVECDDCKGSGTHRAGLALDLPIPCPACAGRGRLASDAVGPGFVPFRYCAKAARAEREEGCAHLPARQDKRTADGGDFAGTEEHAPNRGTRVRNHHPTVKPIDLMRWLCRLVCPPGGVVIDPFMGSGTTGIAAVREGFRFVGIEREPEYMTIAQARIVGDAPLFRRPAPSAPPEPLTPGREAAE